MLAANAGGFSHLLWDVGYDFFSGPRGGVTVDKAGLYGVF